jgi:hypothetical protein
MSGWGTGEKADARATPPPVRGRPNRCIRTAPHLSETAQPHERNPGQLLGPANPPGTAS